MLLISDRPIDVREVERAVRDDGCGGIVTFLGSVRASSPDGRVVTGLHYEAHETMALEEFAKIAEEIRARDGAVRLAIAHRVGELAVGDIAVAVSAAAPHRASAFDACRYAIDELKARAPIWKQERYADGASAWIANEC